MGSSKYKSEAEGSREAGLRVEKAIDLAANGKSISKWLLPKNLGASGFCDQLTSGELELWREIGGFEMKVNSFYAQKKASRLKKMEEWGRQVKKLEGRWYFVFKPNYKTT